MQCLSSKTTRRDDELVLAGRMDELVLAGRVDELVLAGRVDELVLAGIGWMSLSWLV